MSEGNAPPASTTRSRRVIAGGYETARDSDRSEPRSVKALAEALLDQELARGR
jgi:hypothetical protein